jgi:hypothetical protein
MAGPTRSVALSRLRREQAGVSCSADHLGDACEPSTLRVRNDERVLIGSAGVVVAREGRAVRVPATVEDLVDGTPEWNDDRPPVSQGVVEGESRRLLPAVLGLRGRERRRDRSDDVVGVVVQVTTRVAMAIGTCDFAITQRDRRDLIRPPPSTEL